MLDSVLRIGENTREVGVPQGRAQLLQHQGLPQLGARAPALPAGGEKKGHERTARGCLPPAGLPPHPSPGAALPQPAWEMLNEGTIAQPVKDAEVVEAAVGGTGQSQRSI